MFAEGCKATIMRVKVIINPRSGRGRAREQTGLIEKLGHRYGDLDIVPTKRAGHATELAAAAAGEGYDLVAAAGGSPDPQPMRAAPNMATRSSPISRWHWLRLRIILDGRRA